MTIEDLAGFRITSVHCFGWDDYIDGFRSVVDEGACFSINRMYVLEKSEIASLDKSGDTITIRMKNSRTFIMKIRQP